MENLIDRYANKIQGTLSCLDRIVFTGIIPGICYADGMSSLLRTKDIRIFDYTKWAEPLRDEISTNAERLAEENGLEIEFLRKKKFRKEERIKQIIKQRGSHPGLVYIFSAMESCTRYKSDKSAHQVSRLLKRLRKHGLIKKIENTYKYYLTALGRKVTATALKLWEMYIIPSLRTVIVG